MANDCTPSSRFGRGWIPAERDIGLPGEGDSRASAMGSGDAALGRSAFWTAERQVRFLEALAAGGDVRRACELARVSHESAYRLRRRDGTFARGWAAALVLARDHAETVLAHRALEGVDEPVFYHGEQVAVRRRFDPRLLLAHLARLDAWAADAVAVEDAGQFDRVLAGIAGLGEGEGGWGEREAQIAEAADAVQRAFDDFAPVLSDPQAEIEQFAAHRAELEAARTQAADAWDAGFAGACALVDSLIGADVAEAEVEHAGDGDPCCSGPCQPCQPGVAEHGGSGLHAALPRGEEIEGWGSMAAASRVAAGGEPPSPALARRGRAQAHTVKLRNPPARDRLLPAAAQQDDLQCAKL